MSHILRFSGFCQTDPESVLRSPTGYPASEIRVFLPAANLAKAATYAFEHDRLFRHVVEWRNGQEPGITATY